MRVGSAGEARGRQRGGSCAGVDGRAGESAPAATDRERVDSEGACQHDGGSIESEPRHRQRREQKQSDILLQYDLEGGGGG